MCVTSKAATVQEEKRNLRKKARVARAAVPPGEREEAAARLAKALPKHPLLQNVRPGPVLIPTRHADEIDTTPLAHALEGRGWQIHRPRVISDTRDFEVVPWTTPAPLFPGAHGVPEPPSRAESADPGTLRLILVPGLAFTRSGDRLGTGAGYFDRFLARYQDHEEPPITIGMAYRAQLIGEIPTEPHDIPLQGLQVEEEHITCNK
jgi:5-formyltetrahydrofolate cyclo-ligase